MLTAPSGFDPKDELGGDTAAAVKKLWTDAKAYFRPYHEAWREEIDFVLKGRHYLTGSANENTRDRRRIKYRGRESFAKHRRKTAQVANIPFTPKCRPVDEEGDPLTADEARYLLEHEFNDPRRKLRRVVHDVVSSALAARVGALALDVEYRLGRLPMILPRAVRPDKVFWTPGWDDPDDATCPWVMEEFEMSMFQALEMGEHGWKNVERIKPDSARRDDRTSKDASVSLRAASEGAPSPGPWARSDRCTGIRLWIRFSSKRKVKGGRTNALKPEERYYKCPGTDCPYAEMPEGGDGSELTMLGPPCPLCGHPLERVDENQELVSVPAYPDGRLVLVFPKDSVVVYDDAWPWPDLREPPIWVYKAYRIPFEPWGTGDGAIDWSPQLTCNALKRRIYERATGVAGVIIFGEGLRNPATQEDFQWTDEPIQLAQWVGQGAPAVQFFDASGTATGIIAAYNVLQQDFRADMGTGEISVSGTAEQLKGVAVGVAQEVASSGEIPIEDHRQMLRELMASVGGVWYDLMRATYTEARMVRMFGPDGREMYKRLRAAGMPNMDVMIEDEPNWSRFDAERAQALQQLMALPDPAMRRAVVKAMGLPISILNELEEAQRAAVQAPPTPPGPVQPTPSPAGPGPLPRAMLAALQGA